jgi:hypothetical protein
MAMAMAVLLVVVVARTGIRAVGVRVAHHPRMTAEPCCSTSTTTPWPHLQPGRACGDRFASLDTAATAKGGQLRVDGA